ncbi:MAG: HipA domain-containing protein, partial [Lentisphaeria bacterium]
QKENNMNTSKKIYVYFDIHENPQFMGILLVQFIRGKEIASFEFNPSWLTTHPSQLLDPELQFFAGPQYSQKNNFGLFMDSAPDRWGRKLMQRREIILAKQENRPIRPLQQSDYLLGVYDKTRMGGLRFKLSPDGSFLNDNQTIPTPPWTQLRELENACRHLEKDASMIETKKWLSMLIAPGSSLGGARPKANVCDNQNNLWIAKFPNHNDSNNTSAWEYITMQMAKDIGLNTPEIRLEKFSKYGSTFLVKRFDRQKERRIHFASAMTLLNQTDGANATNNISYLDLAEFIVEHCTNITENLQELWTRMTFSIAVSNTDDHLQNHGFLLTDQGWTLSPVYDINPNPDGYGLSLNISDMDNSLDFHLAEEVAPYFRIDNNQMNTILKKIRTVVSHYKKYASCCHIPNNEIESMQNAFQY